mmetsp:Transcript_43488/g.41946  ORF Transcript_43488/g.41946 Transcript_43488/m.41946 type:complete len:126 (+) Transcript_43488:331-708(+)
MSRLQSRVKVPPEIYDNWMSHKEGLYGKKDYSPKGSVEHLLQGTYYLTKVDDKYRRFYAVKDTMAKLEPSLYLASNKLENSQHAGMRRLGQLEGQMTTGEKPNEGIDRAVLKKVTVNFHKKPIEE